jgi:multidrug resistance efflux pump
MPNSRRIIFIGGLIVFLGIIAALGYRYWYQPTNEFFNTDDATVAGSMVRVAAPASGQVSDLYVVVGSTVKKGDVLATLKVTSAAPIVSSAPSVSRVLANVTSPLNGTIVARSVNVGDSIGAGQSIATLVMLDQLWVSANVEEARTSEIRVGQNADIVISAVGRTFHGKVAEIGSATTDLTAAPSLGLSSSDSTKKVSVKIIFDYVGYRLVPGMSASVMIFTHAAP